MQWFERYYDQKAVYWAPAVPDGTGGRSFAEAVEIDVNWQDKEVLFEDATGEEKVSKAAVFVKEDLAEKGYLYRGTLASLPVPHTNPTIIDGAHEIKMTAKNPDLTASYFLRTAWL